MAEIDMNKDLENTGCHRVRILTYYIESWFQKNLIKQKDKLHKIYRYLVDTKPDIQDIFYEEIMYNNILEILEILEILDIYEADKDDSARSAQLFDIKMTLVFKEI